MPIRLKERPINKNTRSDDAKFRRHDTLRAPTADADYAAAVVVNASTYGSDVSPIHARYGIYGTGRAALWCGCRYKRTAVYPDPRTDQGAHSFMVSVVTAI